ncbi:MAG: PadR family transcriptional regulator [Halanaerobiales bacterium]|nr:PadR family transcriptional regulator [Halanaerobiales bacterium]
MARKKSFAEAQLTDSAYYILLALIEPMHGYGIMQYIEELTNKEVLIGPATLYTTLKKMQSAELVVLGEDDTDRRKTYTITEKGKEVIVKEIGRRIRMAEHGKNALSKLKGGN